MARAALNWTLKELEAKSGVGRNTISRYEAGHDILASALDRLEKVLADQGVVFFESDGVYGTGVGLRKRPASKR
jgi:transcriptional regulator with XRE-family HTH domain